MQSRKTLGTYLLINVIVSALTALLVLIVWNRLTAPPAPEGLTENGFAPSTQTPAATLDSGEFTGQLQISAIIGAGDVDNERLRVEHVGEMDVSLAGWRLVDEDGNAYRFPALVLHSGGSVDLFSRQGEDSVTQLFWNRSEAVWSEGEQARLLDPNGQEQAVYTVP